MFRVLFLAKIIVVCIPADLPIILCFHFPDFFIQFSRYTAVSSLRSEPACNSSLSLRICLSFLTIEKTLSAFAFSCPATPLSVPRRAYSRIASSAAGGGRQFPRFARNLLAIRRFRSEFALLSSFAGSGGLNVDRPLEPSGFCGFPSLRLPFW